MAACSSRPHPASELGDTLSRDGPIRWVPTLVRRGLYWLGFTYILLSFLYDRFYGVFGVSSGDVGFGPAQGLGDIVVGVFRVGVWLTAVLLIVTLIAFACAVVLAYVAERCSLRRDGGGVTPGEVLLAVVAAIALWFVAYSAVGAMSVAQQWFDFISIVVVPVGWRIYTRARKERQAATPAGDTRPENAGKGFWQWETMRRRELAALLTIYAVASSAFVFTDLWGDVVEAATQAQGAPPQCSVPDIGAPLPPLPSWLPTRHIHVPLLAVRAVPATIHWIGNDEPGGVFPSMPKEQPIFLGAANGSTFLAVRGGRGAYHAIRMPDAKIVVDINQSAPHCRSVH